MKKILMIFCMLATTLCGFAQQQIVIQLSNGETITKNVWEIESIQFSPIAPIATPTKANAVDLGLSVKWADMNFGAATPEQSGYYIGWGDVSGLNTSMVNNYFPTATPTSHIIAGKYDIVANMWGGDWRLPTDDEIMELVEKCDWAFDASRNGYVISNKSDASKSIFLPLAGKRVGTDTLEVGSIANYWTGMLSSDSEHAVALVADASGAPYATTDLMRYTGCTIRPVYGKYLNGVSVGQCTVSGISSTGATVTVQFNDDYAKASEFGLCYGISDALDADNSDKVTTTTVNQNGSYVFTISGLDPKTKYYFLAYAKYNGNNNYGTVGNFTTQPKYPVPEYVDLGLSVKWAAWNMGAKSEYDYGSYIGWGDPTAENMSYINDDYPNVENICGTEYDVATQIWGREWRLPTSSELSELASLEKDVVTRNGVTGLLIKGKGTKSGNTLFLPMSGYNNYRGNKSVGEKAYYWSGENHSIDYAISCTIGIISGSMCYDDKAIHLSVRPVYAPVAPEETPEEETEEGKSMTAVDLGLSVKWASCNIGASSSSASGTYFAWGETEAKASYTAATYKYYNSATQTYTNIGTNLKNTNMDAAHVLLGGTWRMPSSSDFEELISECNWTWNGSGYTVTSKINGKSIYLPAAGMYSGSELCYKGQQGKYWTCERDVSYLHYIQEDDHWGATLDFTSNNAPENLTGNYQYKGLPIRPVCK